MTDAHREQKAISHIMSVIVTHAIVNVATGQYVRGQQRLRAAINGDSVSVAWADALPPGSPSHYEVPYAFKAFALKAAHERTGADLLLWADASIVPIRSLEALWEKIELDGYWISRNGWTNYQWTAESAYADLGVTPEENRGIPHVVATAFGLSLRHPVGRAIFDEYLRLAGTHAFCGPWANSNNPECVGRARSSPCGPPDVLGHRHDQTALSVIAWRQGCVLTDPPAWFAYEGGETEATFLMAKGI